MNTRACAITPRMTVSRSHSTPPSFLFPLCPLQSIHLPVVLYLAAYFPIPLVRNPSLVTFANPATSSPTLHDAEHPPPRGPVHQGSYTHSTHDCYPVSFMSDNTLLINAPVISLPTLHPAEHPPACGPVHHHLPAPSLPPASSLSLHLGRRVPVRHRHGVCRLCTHHVASAAAPLRRISKLNACTA